MAHRLPTENCETLYGLVRGSEIRFPDGGIHVSLHTADHVMLPSGRSTAPRSESPEPSPVWTNAETVTVSYIVGFSRSGSHFLRLASTARRAGRCSAGRGSLLGPVPGTWTQPAPCVTGTKSGCRTA